MTARQNEAPVSLNYEQRCALRWAIEGTLLISDPGRVPRDWDQRQAGFLLRQARAALRAVDEEAEDG